MLTGIYLATGIAFGLWVLFGTRDGWGHLAAYGHLAYVGSAFIESVLHVRYWKYRREMGLAEALGEEYDVSGEAALTEILNRAFVLTKWPRILGGFACYVAMIAWLVTI